MFRRRIFPAAALHKSKLRAQILKTPARNCMKDQSEMGSIETPNPDSDWGFPPLTDDDLRAIDDAFSAASKPAKRRRLPDSLFIFQKQHRDNSNDNSPPSFTLSPCYGSRFYSSRSHSAAVSPFQDVKFGGRIIYSKTTQEVERAAQELLDFVEAKKRSEVKCILGLDIEWRPTFRKGVAQGKAAVLQICGENNCCHVLHIVHSGIPKRLQQLLEDPTSVKVGVCIAGDAGKILRDHNVSVKTLEDLSDIANQKLGGEQKKWSLSSLTETLVCKQLPKPYRIRLGNWEAKVLSKEQLNYAATDAYISWYLYQVLKNLPDPVENKSAEIDHPT